MKNIYYLLWADSILSIKKYHPNKKDWKIALFTLNTWVNALHFWTIILWLKYFKIFIMPQLKIDVFPGKLLDNFFAFAIVFALPFGILNYFLIFYRNRYKKIVVKYDKIIKKKGRFAFIYSLIVVLGAFFSAILYGILT